MESIDNKWIQFINTNADKENGNELMPTDYKISSKIKNKYDKKKIFEIKIKYLFLG